MRQNAVLCGNGFRESSDRLLGSKLAKRDIVKYHFRSVCPVRAG